MNKIQFHLPGLFEKFYFYQNFIQILKNNSEKFYSDFEISSIYGAPLNALWNGGRYQYNQTAISEDFILKFLKINNISCSLIFSNSLLEEKHLSDTYCNSLLQKFNNENNSIVLASNILEIYIRKNFPNYKIISSTTKCLNNEEDQLNELNKNYDIVVLDYNHNNNFDFLKQLPNKHKCEFLINPVCIPRCQYRKQHYENISLQVLDPSIKPFKCKNATCRIFEYTKNNPLFISRDFIKNIYIPMGFKHFKIEGRLTSEENLLEILLYYLVKPEYQDEIRQKMNELNNKILI